MYNSEFEFWVKILLLLFAGLIWHIIKILWRTFKWAIVVAAIAWIAYKLLNLLGFGRRSEEPEHLYSYGEGTRGSMLQETPVIDKKKPGPWRPTAPPRL